MKWFSNLKIGKKVFIASMCFMLIIIGISFQSITSMNSANNQFKDFYEDRFMPVRYLNRILRNLLQIRINMVQQIVNAEVGNWAEVENRIRSSQELAAAYQEEWARFASTEMTETEQKLVDQFDEKARIPAEIRARFGQAINNRDIAAVRILSDEWLVGYRDLRDFIDQIIKLQNDEAQNIMADVEQSANLVFMISIIILAASIIMAGIITLVLTRSVSGPVMEAVKYAETLAKLDLTIDVSEDALSRKDEIGALANSFQTLIDALKETVVGITGGAQQVATATEQIGQDNENLSQRTSEQASSLEEIAATIEESNATTKQNSDNAIEASKLTNNTLSLAENGGIVVGEAVKSIGEINASSARIADIISMINEIAFQTNLLALNAAVEAARAGDQGRGFAVVAGEVRNLAQRSGEAAKEIGVLIKDSVDKIGNGTELVNKSGEALREIIQAVKQVNNLVSEMAAASDEQRRGIEQINTAVTEMDNMTQQNAALVEETASASEEMSSQAQELLSMVQRFNVGSAIESITEYSKSGANRNRGAAGRSTSAAADVKKVKPPVQMDVKKGLLEDGGYEEF